MAPATEAVMGALPLEKASVGSAMNDATRMVGGALGVAVLGSVLASGYRSGSTSRGLTPAAADAARTRSAGPCTSPVGPGPLSSSRRRTRS